MTTVDDEHALEITTPDLRDIGRPDAIDPDISATLTDFLTYTEHLPSLVARSLGLITEQDRIAVHTQQKLNGLLVTYGQLPKLTDPPNSVKLRRDISHAIARLQRARRMASAEAYRMQDMVSRDRDRLGIIAHKLKSIPLPPSRDPTPQPMTSPLGKKASAHSERVHFRPASVQRLKGDERVVPGEVLPPLEFLSPLHSDMSDADASDADTPRPRARPRLKLGTRQRASDLPRTLKLTVPRSAEARKNNLPGTNPRSAGAGVSTANALLALVPPPSDARLGSVWLPWKRITEFELARLRKRMKKNAVWRPSPAMRNRELKTLGRGQQNMDDARHRAETGGEPFIDEGGEDWKDPTCAIVSGQEKDDMRDMFGPEVVPSSDVLEDGDALINRGMRLNEAKKRKREKEADEQHSTLDVQPEVPPEVQSGLQPAGSLPLPTVPVVPDMDIAEPQLAESTVTVNSPSSHKKRKRDTLPIKDDEAVATALITPKEPEAVARPIKKLKLTVQQKPKSPSPAIARVASPRVSAPRAESVKRGTHSSSAPAISSPRRHTPSATPQAEPSLRKQVTAKPLKTAAAEPAARRISSRRSSGIPQGQPKSTTSKLEAAQTATSARGRRKRSLPDQTKEEEDDVDRTISVGRPKKQAHRKSQVASRRTSTAKQKASSSSDDDDDEEVDKDEKLYCYCQRPSAGGMIACEHQPKVSFHMRVNTSYADITSAKTNGFIGVASMLRNCRRAETGGIVLIIASEMGRIS